MANLDAYYPVSPKNVPEDLTQASGQYRSRVILVLLSLIFFFVLYIGLILTCVATIILGIIFLGCVGVLIALPVSLFLLFLLKNFFKRGDKEASANIEVTEEDQPLLFAFLDRLCEETGAPRPHKVFVSAEVNAAVFYNTSVLSLFLPTPKNLLIGLGLVNVLTLSELKAVLAHEFGHFSQDSMKLGTYVYTAHKIILDMIGGRDWFDDMLDRWSRVDIRVAWVAWLMIAVIWIFRKILEGFFYLIHLLHRSLSREQEFHADLVAVSVAGSDAGPQALYRLDFAEEVWDRVLGELLAAHDHKLYTADIFYHLNHASHLIRKEKKDPNRGNPPALPENPRETPDLFKEEDEGTLKMWATHPTHFDREQNAKSYYIRCRLDERSGWVLFRNPEHLREEVTYRFYRVNAGIRKRDLELADPREVQQFIDDEREETTYDPQYHGVYDSRLIEIDDANELIQRLGGELWPVDRLERVHAGLYDAELEHWMKGYKKRNSEHDMLVGLVHGGEELKTEDLEFRGRSYDPEDAPRLLKKVEKELEADRDHLKGLDRRVFLVFWQMARVVGEEMPREMRKRYEFHLTSQEMLRKLRAEFSLTEAALNHFGGKGDIHPDDFRELLKVCRGSHKELIRALETADDLPLPELKNMEKGKPLGSFLLDRRVVQRLDRDATSISGDWVQRFLNQMGEVLKKLHRIHFKSLGGILLLQERIYQRWRQKVSTAPEVQPVDEIPEVRSADEE